MTTLILTLTKILPKKWGYSFVDFQIVLSTYKLDFQNKNYIYKIKTQVFYLFFYYNFATKKKKKASLHAQSACDEASIVSIYLLYY